MKILQIITESSPPDLMKAFEDFLPLAMAVLKIDKLPPIKIVKDVPGEQPSFGGFDQDSGIIYLQITNRHPLDIFRTLAHELVHFKQKTEHKLDGQSGATGSPEENEANATAGIVMRHFNKKYPQYLSHKPLIKEDQSDYEISNYDKLDKILVLLCKMVVKGQKKDKDYYGMVAACVLDPDNNIVAKVNYPTDDGKRVHAERAAMEAYQSKYGEIPEGSIIITTLSPCNEISDETADGRSGNNCTDLINHSPVRKVYCGYMDPSQGNEAHTERDFNLMETENGKIRDLCKSFADTFLDEDYHPNDTPPGPETPPTMPAGTVRVDVSDVYDWYKLGKNIANLKQAKASDFGKGPPSTIMAFGSEPEEHKYINNLKKLGLTTTDIDPLDPKQPKKMPRQKVDRTYNVGVAENLTPNTIHRLADKKGIAWDNEPSFLKLTKKLTGYEHLDDLDQEGLKKVKQHLEKQGVEENFADGKNPGRKGLAKRSGVNTKASVSTLRNVAKHSSGEKQRMAHWLANMKAGRAK